MIYLGIIIGIALTLFLIAGLGIWFHEEVQAEIEAEVDFQDKLHDQLISARGEVEDLRNEVEKLTAERNSNYQAFLKMEQQYIIAAVDQSLMLQKRLSNPPHVSSIEVAAGVVVDLDEARKGLRSRDRETMKQKIAAITPQIAEKVEDQDDARE